MGSPGFLPRPKEERTLFKEIKKKIGALAGVAQWTECQPVNQRVAGLIPHQGTCLGWGPVPQQGMHERQPHIDVSLPFFSPPIPLSKKK